MLNVILMAVNNRGC